MKIRYIEISQPIGNFYLTSLEASVLAKIADVRPRGQYPDAIQREESKKRVKEIRSIVQTLMLPFLHPL